MGRGVAALGRGSEADGGSNFQHERGRSPAESGSENGRAQQRKRLLPRATDKRRSRF